MTLKKVYNLLLLGFLFLLPWQTRYIWQYGELNEGYWEYGTFSIYGTEILLWIILILFFVQHFLRKEFWANLKEKPRRNSFVLVLFFLLLSMAVSKNFWVSYSYIFKLLEGMAFFVVLSAVIPSVAEGSLKPDERDSFISLRSSRNDRLRMALWLGGVVQGALAIWQFLTQHVWASKWLGMAGQEAQNLGPSVIEFADQRWLRAYGSFGSPNSLGIYLAVLFVLGLVLYLKTESGRNKIFISIGQLFILSGLLVSFSRGAWLAAIFGTVSLFGVLVYKQKLSLPSLAKQILFASAVIIFWLVIFYPVFTARFNLANRLEVKSISERKSQYAEVLTFIKSNPILGTGPGAYTYALYKKYPTLPSWQYQPIHNIYLLALVEFGLAGAIFLFFLFKQLFWSVIKNNPVYVPVIVTLVFAGIFDHWLISMYTGIVFLWVVWGLMSVEKPNIDN